MNYSRNYIFVVVLWFVCSLLSACSSGGSSPPLNEPRLIAADANDTTQARATAAAASGEAVTYTTTAASLTPGTPSTTVFEAVPASIEYTDNNGANEVSRVTVTTSGGSLTFERSELINRGDFERRDAQGNYVAGLFISHGGYWDEYANGNGAHQYLIPYRTSFNEGDNTFSRGYGVIGLETSDENVAARTGTATYTGQLANNSGGVLGRAFSDASGERIARFRADVTVNADFSQGQITGGSITNIRERGSQTQFGVSSLNIDSSAINGNDFGTTVSCASAATCANGSITRSDFRGTFYGDSAQEVGGTATWSWQAGTDTLNLSDHTAGAAWSANQN